MTQGICALCVESKTLRCSHIISNAVFRRIKQAQNSGQLILMDDSDDAPIHRSQETWSEYLLCGDCEHVIGAYESYGLELLRARPDRQLVEDHADGVTFRAYDYRRFKLFLTSLLWRAAVSQQQPFSKVKLPDRCKEAARASLLAGKALLPLRLGCRLHRLVDSTPAGEGGFTMESLRQLVISPIARLRDDCNYYTLLFVIEGFLFEYFVRAVPFRQAGQHGVVKDSSVLFVSNKRIFDVPEIANLLIAGYAKHDRGLIAFKNAI